jgi:hypothetical protein
MKPLNQTTAGHFYRSLRMSALAVIAAHYALTGHARAADEQVFVLECPTDATVWNLPPKGLHWKTLHKLLDDKAAQLIKIIDRSKVGQSFHLDIEGLRLNVSSRECLATFKKLSLESTERITPGYLIRNLLGRRYRETGIQPDRIPITGDAGKKLGTQGMVLIKGGEYVRPGHYYTSQSAELSERRGDKYRVRVSDFHIDKYKVTNEEYCRFLNDGNSGYWNSAPWSNVKRDKNGLFYVDEDNGRGGFRIQYDDTSLRSLRRFLFNLLLSRLLFTRLLQSGLLVSAFFPTATGLLALLR